MEDRVWKRVPDGTILIDEEGYNQWVENGNGLALQPSNQSRSHSRTKAFCAENSLNCSPLPLTWKRVALHRSAILHAIATGTFDYAVTFPDSTRRFKFSEEKGAGYALEVYLESWVEKQKQHIKSSTWNGVRKIVYNALIPKIGRIYLNDLKRSDIRKLCDDMPDASNKRLSNIQSVLRSSLRDALDDDLIETNPLHDWTYSRKEAPKPTDDVDPFSIEEQEAILKYCKHPQQTNLIRFALWTGLRTSELVALLWGDIDWIRGVIKVQRGRTQDRERSRRTKNTAKHQRSQNIITSDGSIKESEEFNVPRRKRNFSESSHK